MSLNTLFASLCVVALATAASAQTKTSGTLECAKADPVYTIAVGDRPNHSFVIAQRKCTSTKPYEIVGIQSKEGVATSFAEVRGETSRLRGYYVDVMADGDNAYYRFEGTSNLKDGVGEQKWQLTRGTGKLKGIKGNGVCKVKVAADGTETMDCEGEYELPK